MSSPILREELELYPSYIPHTTWFPIAFAMLLRELAKAYTPQALPRDARHYYSQKNALFHPTFL